MARLIFAAPKIRSLRAAPWRFRPASEAFAILGLYDAGNSIHGGITARSNSCNYPNAPTDIKRLRRSRCRSYGSGGHGIQSPGDCNSCGMFCAKNTSGDDARTACLRRVVELAQQVGLNFSTDAD
ncbi:hypothetical protein Zmor_009684 [Zophobas morio]|uniref:Uncharacterized protein n=1 Tax=Zophobas morio TaxID=2755281 RepID=A0AA38MJ12_9CUCU|nr:hypothetical protein Zmor_009684 [Zophobas morio]